MSVKSAEIVTGAALVAALGFANARAFQRARKAGRIGIALYPVPGQSRGVYAYKRDIESYRAAQLAVPLGVPEQ